MKCTDLFKTHLLLWPVLLSSCAQNEMKTVTSSTYSQPECWIDRDGYLATFLILAEDNKVIVPYAVSSKCWIRGDYANDGEAILHHLNTIRVVDTEGVLQSTLPQLTVSDTLRSDQPMPSSNSKIYYLKARVSRLSDTKLIAYTITNVKEFNYLNIYFDRFLGLSKTEREQLVSASDSQK